MGSGGVRLSETDSGTCLAISSTSSCIARTDTSAVSTAATTCRWRACATSDSAGEPPSEGIGIMPDCITPEGNMPGGIMPSNPVCIDPCDDIAPCMGCTSVPPAGGHADAESCMDGWAGHGGHTGGGAGCSSALDGTPACIACCIACCIEPCMTPCMAP